MVETIGNTSYAHITKVEPTALVLLTSKLLKWPPQYRLPAYDLLRILHLHHSSEKLYSGLDSGISLLTDLGVCLCQTIAQPVMSRLLLQTLCNLFRHGENTFAALRHTSIIADALRNSTLYGSQDEKVALLPLTSLLL